MARLTIFYLTTHNPHKRQTHNPDKRQAFDCASTGIGIKIPGVGVIFISSIKEDCCRTEDGDSVVAGGDWPIKFYGVGVRESLLPPVWLLFYTQLDSQYRQHRYQEGRIASGMECAALLVTIVVWNWEKFNNFPLAVFKFQRRQQYSDQFNTDVLCSMSIQGFICKMQFDTLNGASSSLNALRVFAYKICIKIYHLLTLNILFVPLKTIALYMAYYAKNLINF